MKTLDIDEAAKLLKLHPESLRRICRRGDIPARKIGKRWIFTESALEDWVNTPYTQAEETRLEVQSWQNHLSQIDLERGTKTSGSTKSRYDEVLKSLYEPETKKPIRLIKS